MKIELDQKKGLPIYLQIIEQVRHKVAAGQIAVGEQLPTVRALAVSLEVNPNTIAKAYTELERSGVIETRQGVGTFVVQSEHVVEDDEREKKLDSLVKSFFREALWFGFTPEEIVGKVGDYAAEKE